MMLFSAFHRQSICWLTCIALLLCLSVSLTAKQALAQQTQVTLPDAMAAGSIVVEQTVSTTTGTDGRSYVQPLIIMEVQNASQSDLVLTLPAGLELVATDGNGPSLVTLGLEPSELVLEAGSVQPVRLQVVAFLLDIDLFPIENQPYELVLDSIPDSDLLPLLETIEEQGGYLGTTLVPQVAVWQQHNNLECHSLSEEMRTVFGFDIPGGCNGTFMQQVEELQITAQRISGDDSETPADNASGIPGTVPQDNQPGASGASGGGTGVENGPNLVGWIFGILFLVVVGITALQVLRSKATDEPDPETPIRPGSQPTRDRGTPAPDPGRSTSGFRGAGEMRSSSGTRYDVPTGPLDHASAVDSAQANTNNQAQPSGSPPSTSQSSRGVGRFDVPTAPLQQPEKPSQPVYDEPVQPQKPSPSTSLHEANNSPSAGSAKRRRFAVGTQPMPGVPAEKTPNPSTLPEALLVPRLELINLEDNTTITISQNTLLSREEVEQLIIEHNSETISSPQCVIRYVNGKWLIRDLNSRNGTLVNGQKVGVRDDQKDMRLEPGCRVEMGDVVCKFEGDPDGQHATLSQLDQQSNILKAYTFEAGSETSPYWLITANELTWMQVDYRSVSVPHALIQFSDGWKIRDLRSSSGTLISGVQGADSTTQTVQVGAQPEKIRPGMHLSLSGEVRYVLNQPALPQVGTYELLHWVGSGGLASVFLARNATKPAQTARDLVLKLLKNAAPEAQQAFDSECTFLSEMDDPFIVPYVDHDEDPEYGKYIVLHYIEGSTLETILRARQTIPVAELVAIALQVCYALRAIHRKGKVHCDIKPENILIGLDGQVKVIDLGAVTSFEDQPGYASTLYQPPEFAEQPPGRVTARSDIYSLGLVMFEMLYGKYILNPNNALSEHARSLQQQRAVLVRDMTIVTLPMVEQATHGQKKLEMPENNKLSPIIERCLRMQDEYLSIQPLIDHLEKVQREFDTNPNIAWLHEKDG